MDSTEIVIMVIVVGMISMGIVGIIFPIKSDYRICVENNRPNCEEVFIKK